MAHRWRVSRFVISFFFLGLFTSLPEIFIGAMAVAEDAPHIFTGNLLGATIVLFLLVIPLLALVNGKVSIPKQARSLNLLLMLTVIVTPALLTFDQKITQFEGWVMIGLYLLLCLIISEEQPFWEKIRHALLTQKKKNGLLMLKVVVGVILLLISSRQIISSTLYFAQLLKLSPFFISLIVVALGTNLPELSLIVRAIWDKKNDIALADYLGSAVANTFLFGVLTVFYGNTILLPNHFLQRFVFLVVGLVLFFFFARSRNTVSRHESIILLILYALFLFVEFSITSPT